MQPNDEEKKTQLEKMVSADENVNPIETSTPKRDRDSEEPKDKLSSDVLASFFSSRQLATMLVGGFLIAFGFMSWFVHDVIYGHLNDEIKELKSQVTDLQTRLKDDITYAVRVEDLLKESPRLSQQIEQTNKLTKDVNDIVIHLKTLVDGPPNIPTQFQDVQQGIKKIELQTTNIQSRLEQLKKR